MRYVCPNTVLLRAAQDETDKKYLDSVEYYIKTQRPNVRVLRLQIPYVDETNSEIRKHNWCYVNFLRLGNKILIPQLGIEDDATAIYQFKNIFVGCEIKPINMLQIVAAGGGALLTISTWNHRSMMTKRGGQSIRKVKVTNLNEISVMHK